MKYLLDLFDNLMLRVVDTRDQGSFQGEFSSFVSVARREYAKAFEVTVDMLNTYPPLGEFRIGAFLLRAQLVFFRTLFGKRTLGMQLGQTAIASVGENQGVAGKRQSAVLEQLKIVPLPLATRKAEDIPTGGINDKLNFQGVFLFLARIIPALFFLGRSISHSVASTSTVSKCASWGNRRLVGKFNCPLCISVFSTHRMLSQIVLLATA